MTPGHVVLYVVSGLASAAPGVVQRWVQHRRERKSAREVLEVKLLRRLQDTAQGTYADVYDLAVLDNYTAGDIHAALDRLKRRGLVERHPDGRWVVSERGRVAVGAPGSAAEL